MRRLTTAGIVGATLAAAVVWGLMRWLSVAYVEGLAIPACVQTALWVVYRTSGDSLAVKRERDTLTTEAVFRSRQVENGLARLRRRYLLTVGWQSVAGVSG